MYQMGQNGAVYFAPLAVVHLTVYKGGGSKPDNKKAYFENNKTIFLIVWCLQGPVSMINMLKMIQKHHIFTKLA